MDLLLLALLVALGVWTARRVKARWATARAARVRAKTPGFTADNPIVLRRAAQLDDAVTAARCACGGRVRSLGETSRLGLRVVRARCVECEDDLDLYFVLPKFVN